MTTTINNEHKKLNAPNKREQNPNKFGSALAYLGLKLLIFSNYYIYLHN